MQTYTTGDVARLCGISVRTVQYYDNRKLLCPSALSEGGRRLYSAQDLETMKLICFLRDTGLSLQSIAELLASEDSQTVIDALLAQQEATLQEELRTRQGQLQRVADLRCALQGQQEVSLATLGDLALRITNKPQLRRLHLMLLAMGLPITLLQWSTVLLWIAKGIWWPYAAQLVLGLPAAVWLSVFYFARVAYICPHCHAAFRPGLREAFFANHTPTLRKLTCPHCHQRSFCIEIYRKKETQHE